MMNNKETELENPRIHIDALFHGLLDDPPHLADHNETILDLMLKGGVNTVSTTVVADTYNDVTFNDLCNEIYRYYLLEEAYPHQVRIIQDYEDIFTAYREKKLGVILSTQGSDFLEGNLRFISIAYKLGLRIVQITYNQQCSMGSGVFEPHDTGLTRFGQQAIYEMNRVGMVIDVSHVGYQTALDAIECSSQPILFSHSGVMALCKNKRNADDVQIKALAKKGGVLALCPHSVMCTDDRSKPPTVDVFIDHMIYVGNLVGMDHVAIGTDRFVQKTLEHTMGRINFERTLPGFFGGFDISAKQVQGFNRFSDWSTIADAMSKRGISNEDITKILGGNLLRLFKCTWFK